MEKKPKKKLSAKAFRRNGTIAIALILVLAIGATIACNVFSQSLDTYVGRGERRVVSATNIDPDSTNYYTQRFVDTNSENGSVAYGLEVTHKITDEGEVLMKNNGILPLAEGSTVTPFGYRYVDPVHGGTGSGNVDSSKPYIVTPQQGLSAFFTVNNEVAAILEKATPQELTATGLAPAASESGKGFDGATTSILEVDPQIYASAASSCNGTTGIVFIGRVGGEGGNLQTTPYADGTAHELQLTEYEKDTITFAKSNCDSVVAIINSSNVMELGLLMSGEYEVDAILWVGGPGATGFASMGAILSGTVNPSGRTADISRFSMLGFKMS